MMIDNLFNRLKLVHPEDDITSYPIMMCVDYLGASQDKAAGLTEQMIVPPRDIICSDDKSSGGVASILAQLDRLGNYLHAPIKPSLDVNGRRAKSGSMMAPLSELRNGEKLIIKIPYASQNRPVFLTLDKNLDFTVIDSEMLTLSDQNFKADWLGKKIVSYDVIYPNISSPLLTGTLNNIRGDLPNWQTNVSYDRIVDMFYEHINNKIANYLVYSEEYILNASAKRPEFFRGSYEMAELYVRTLLSVIPGGTGNAVAGYFNLIHPGEPLPSVDQFQLDYPGTNIPLSLGYERINAIQTIIGNWIEWSHLSYRFDTEQDNFEQGRNDGYPQFQQPLNLTISPNVSALEVLSNIRSIKALMKDNNIDPEGPTANWFFGKTDEVPTEKDLSEFCQNMINACPLEYD